MFEKNWGMIMRRKLFANLCLVMLFIVLVSGCAKSGGKHDASPVEPSAPVSEQSDLISTSDSALVPTTEEDAAFEEEILAGESDLWTEQMSVEEFIDRYHTPLLYPTNLPESYHHVNAIFVKDQEGGPLVSEFWIDTQNREYLVLQQICNDEILPDELFAYDDQIVSPLSWIKYRALYYTSYDGHPLSVCVFMEQDRGEAYCKEIVSSFEVYAQ